MLLMGRFGEENYSRAATVQDLLDLGIVNIDRGALYATGGGGSSSGGSSNAASAAADRAQTSATNAASSASSASTSASSASTSASLASTAADQASNFSSLASASADLAEDWASKAEDSVVDLGKYSALHYAAKAEDSAIAASSSASAAAASAQDAEDALLLEETTEKTDSYTLVLADQNKVVLMNVSAAGKAITVPTNASVAFPVGSVVHIYNASADSVSVDGDTGVTVRNTGSVSQYGEARLRKRATNEWVLTIY
jgi:hypothetical protein